MIMRWLDTDGRELCLFEVGDDFTQQELKVGNIVHFSEPVQNTNSGPAVPWLVMLVEDDVEIGDEKTKLYTLQKQPANH
jgi:hypothetical protein